MKKTMLAALLAGLSCASQATVTTVWDNGAANTFATNSGVFSSTGRDYQVFDDFTLSSTQRINSVWFQGNLPSGSGFTGSFAFQIYNSALSGIGSLIGNYSLSSGGYTASEIPLPIHAAVRPLYSVEFTIPTLTLGSGSYYVSFLGTSLDLKAPNVGSGNGFLQGKISAPGSTSNLLGNTPFKLLFDSSIAAVPEPESYAMLSLGLGLIGWLGRRRRTGSPAAA